jgi:ATP-dependent DNA helicase RecG
MAELNMIDTMGYGIRRMATSQAGRYLPLPDYDLNEKDMVRLTVYGGVVDPAYTRMLMQRTDLSLTDVLALDRVQKKLPVPDDVVRRLRGARLVEGRKPHLHVTADVAAVTGNKADYIRTRAQDDAHYSALVLNYLKQYGGATRGEIDDLLGKYLNEGLLPQQKRNKVTNLLAKMRRAGQIHNAGSRPNPRWQLS